MTGWENGGKTVGLEMSEGVIAGGRERDRDRERRASYKILGDNYYHLLTAYFLLFSFFFSYTSFVWF